MSVQRSPFILLGLAVAGSMVAVTVAGRAPASAASNLPNRLFVAQLAADSGSAAAPAPSGSPTSSTPAPTATRTPTATPTPPETVEPIPTYVPPDPYYPYPY